jgi:hypothetical protein
MRPHLEKNPSTQTKEGWWSGSRCLNPKFKPQYRKKQTTKKQTTDTGMDMGKRESLIHYW